MRDPKQTVPRRGLLAGAGAVGALAAVAAVLPGGQQAVADAKVADAKPAPDTASGYRLTEHVKRYYSSARI
jgi:O-antigen ligase